MHRVALVLLLAGSAISTLAPAAGASTPCTWNAYADFRFAPNDANPSPDSCGNPSVWLYMMGEPHAPASYSPMPTFLADFGGHPEAQYYCGTLSGCDIPLIGVNRGPTFTYASTVTVPSGTMLMHPGAGARQDAILAWRSPITGTVSISGGLRSDDGHGGNGIQWWIDRGTTILAGGSYGNGGSQTFAAADTGGALSSVGVSRGDTIYLLIDPNGADYYYDSTGVDFTIQQLTPSTPTPELPAMALVGVGVAVLVGLALRSRR